MQVRPGDQVIIEGHRIGTPPRRGEVLAVAGSTLTVAWEDGHETVFVPGSDCRVLRDEEAGTSDVDRFGGNVELRVIEDGDHCEAVATLMTRRGTFEGRGSSRRHPNDPNVPAIGEELAIGRALEALSDNLLNEGMSADPHGEVPASHLLA